MTKITQGIDVSKWQGVVDFKKVKADGYEFVILNAGYGKYLNQKDPTFEQNYINAKEAGLAVGAYWYSYAQSVADAKLEADTFIEVLKGRKFEYPIAFDIEDESQLKLSKSLIGDICEAFCSKLEKAGYYTCLYSYSSFLINKIPESTKSKYDIWLAEFTSATSPTYNGSYGIWQHSSRGSVNGVLGDVDLNRSYKDYPTIIKDAGLNGYPKTDKKKTVKGDVNGDGKIDVTDVSKLTAHVKGVKPLADTEKKAADINDDGRIDVADVSKLSNVVKGSSSSDTPKKEEWVTHTVVSGDTLWAISQKYGVSVVRLAANNNIKNVNLIYPGQVLKIKTK